MAQPPSAFYISRSKHNDCIKIQASLYPPATQKRRGSALLAVVLILAVISSIMSVGTAKITQAAINSTGSNKTTLQAQQYAASEAELIKSINYTDLSAQTRADISDSGFQKEVILSDESDYSDTIKQKTATIKIYKGNETLARASLNLTRYSVEQKASGVPIGTIIAWASSNNPTDGTWLECNGQSCATYAELTAVLGKSTVPDYRGRFLEGNNTAGTIKEPGLPNIEGTITLRMGNYGAFPTRLFTYTSSGSEGYKGGAYGNYGEVNFDASRANPIYGAADTVQPPSVTVRYFIKAA